MDHRAPAEEGVPVNRRLMDVLQRILERDGPRVLWGDPDRFARPRHCHPVVRLRAHRLRTANFLHVPFH